MEWIGKFLIGKFNRKIKFG